MNKLLFLLIFIPAIGMSQVKDTSFTIKSTPNLGNFSMSIGPKVVLVDFGEVLEETYFLFKTKHNYMGIVKGWKRLSEGKVVEYLDSRQKKFHKGILLWDIGIPDNLFHKNN